jgi:nucleoside-diphosphate-sugar epimerase
MCSSARIRRDKDRIRPENSEVTRLWCDNKKLSQSSGFQPQISLRDGLRLTIEWMKKPENLRHYKMNLYNV